MKNNEALAEPFYHLPRPAADLIYKFACEIGHPLVHYDKDKVVMLEEFVEKAKTAAINITFHLHKIDAQRYSWTDGKKGETT